MDEKDYYATFLMDDADYVAWFDEGTWIRSTHNIDNADLPLPVQKAINASYPGYTITDVDLDDFKGMEVYEVTMEKGMSRVQVEYRPNGTAVKTKDRSGTKVDVANVTDAMESDFATRYPEATTVTWYRYIPRDRVEVVATDWDYDMDANDYEVRYTMSGTPYVAFYDNGTWIRTESVTFDKGSLPAVVSSAIRRDYAGYTIEDVNMEDFKGAQVYEVELNSTTMGRCKIHYKMDGSIAKQKCVKNGVKTKS
jgi:uncharacterized membrane protein YkoI